MHVIVHGAISDKAKGDYLIYEDMIYLPSFIIDKTSGESFDKLVLHSCYAGKDSYSYAGRLSSLNPDIYVIAPNNQVVFLTQNNENCFFVNASEYVQTENGIQGVWNIFKSGKIVASFDGTIIPTSQIIDSYLKECDHDE